MNRKQFIVLLAIVVLVGAAGWIVYQRGNSSWQSASQTIGGNLLPNLSVNDITWINIKSGTNELTLARRDNLWRVRERADYPANFSQISDLLMKFTDLKIVQSDEAEASQLARFDLLPPGPATNTGTLVEMKDQSGRTLASILLGKDHINQPARGGDEGGPDGRYVMADNDGKDVAVISETFDNVQPKPEDWLDKTFFKIENPKSIAVTFPTAANSWKLTRVSETNDWQLAGAKPGDKLDSSKLDSVTNAFDSPSFDDVSPGSVAPANATVVTVETFDDLTYTAKIWPEQEGNYSMTISIATKPKKETLADKPIGGEQFENWTYRIPDYTVETLLKPISQLLLETNKTGSSASVGSN